MSAHAEIVRDRGLAKLRSFKRAIESDWHNIQTHDNQLDDLLRLLKHAKSRHNSSSVQASENVEASTLPNDDGGDNSESKEPLTLTPTNTLTTTVEQTIRNYSQLKIG